MLIMSVSSVLLGSLITLVIMAAVLSIFFYVSYHTFHGNLPEKFQAFLIILGIIIVIVVAVWCASYFF